MQYLAKQNVDFSAWYVSKSRLLTFIGKFNKFGEFLTSFCVDRILVLCFIEARQMCSLQYPIHSMLTVAVQLIFKHTIQIV